MLELPLQQSEPGTVAAAGIRGDHQRISAAIDAATKGALGHANLTTTCHKVRLRRMTSMTHSTRTPVRRWNLEW